MSIVEKNQNKPRKRIDAALIRVYEICKEKRTR